MDQNLEHLKRARMTRRTAIGGTAAVLGFAATGVGAARAATEDGAGPVVNAALGELDNAAVDPAPTTPGVHYWSVAGIDLKSAISTQVFGSSTGELNSSSGGAFTTPVQLPHGSRITEVVTYINRPNASSTQVRLIAHQSSNLGFQQVGTASSNTLPNPSALSALTMTIPASAPLAVVNNLTTAYFVIVNLPADAAHFVAGIRVGYVPSGVLFFPITPARFVDTRIAAFSNSGILTPNTNRVFVLKDGRDAAGTITTADIIPAGATAVSANVTVNGATGPNYLAITPGDATTFAASTINFPGGFDLANGGTFRLDSSRQVKVFCGDQGGSTHVIIDVNGYYA